MDVTLLRKLAAEIVANRNVEGSVLRNGSADLAQPAEVLANADQVLVDGASLDKPAPPVESVVTIRADKVVLQVQNLTIVVNPEVRLNPTIHLDPTISVAAADVTVNVPEMAPQVTVNVPEQGAPVVNLPELRPIIQVRPANPAQTKEVKFQLNDDGVPVAAVVSEVNR